MNNLTLCVRQKASTFFPSVLTTLYLALFTVSSLWLLSCQQNKRDIINEPYKEKQAQVAKVLEDIFTSAKAKDFEKLNSFHLNSAKFTKFDNAGNLNRQNFEENRQGEEAVFKAVEGFEYQLKNVKVDVFDNVAIATFLISYTAKMQGVPLADTARSTLVFIDNEGKWLITHEHFSKLR